MISMAFYPLKSTTYMSDMGTQLLSAVDAETKCGTLSADVARDDGSDPDKFWAYVAQGEVHIRLIDLKI